MRLVLCVAGLLLLSGASALAQRLAPAKVARADTPANRLAPGGGQAIRLAGRGTR